MTEIVCAGLSFHTASLAVRGPSVEAGQPLWPSDAAQFTYAGQAYDLYQVPLDGRTRQLALVKPGREQSTFVDPADPRRPIQWPAARAAAGWSMPCSRAKYSTWSASSMAGYSPRSSGM